jgi:hypothetical protein
MKRHGSDSPQSFILTLVHVFEAGFLLFKTGNTECGPQRIAHRSVERLHRRHIPLPGVLRSENLRTADRSQEPVKGRGAQEKRLRVPFRRREHRQFVRAQIVLRRRAVVHERSHLRSAPRLRREARRPV